MLIGPFAGTAIVVSGGDRRSYLDDVSTQRLDDLDDGDARAALVLDVHGGALAEFVVAAGPDRDWLLAPEGADQHVLEVLARRTFLADVRFEASDHQVLSLRGDDVEELVGAVLTEGLPESRWVTEGAVSFVRHRFGVEAWGPEPAMNTMREALERAGASSATQEELDRYRVRIGEPRFAHEVAPPHLPEELGLLPSHVHLGKGCYPGQEAVARMWMLGRPRRHLARVEVAGPVEVGDSFGSGRQRAEITGIDGSGRHGLAFVPADAEPGSTFEDGPRSLRVVEVVGAGLPQPGHDPAMTRRRDRRGTSAR